MIYIVQATTSPDTTWLAYKSSLLTSICINVSLTTSCIAFVKPFLDSVHTGLLSTDVRNQDINKSALDSGRARLQFALDAIGLGSSTTKLGSIPHAISTTSRANTPAGRAKHWADSEEAILGLKAAPQHGERVPSRASLELQNNPRIITKTTDMEVFRS